MLGAPPNKICCENIGRSMTSAWWRMKLAPRVSDAISDAWASYNTDRNHYLPVPDVTDILCDSLWLHYLMIPFSMHQTRAILRINSLTMREAPRVGRIVWTQRIMKWVRADLLESQSREEQMKSLRTILESLSIKKKITIEYLIVKYMRVIGKYWSETF